MKPIVELRDVTFSYGGAPILEDVSLHLHRGQFAALVGPSGAGKTSVLRLVMGTLRPTRGRVAVGEAAAPGRPRPQIGYVPQVETVDWNFPVTVEQVVLMGRVRGAGRLPWPSRQERRAVADMLDRLGIGALARRHIRDLSGGQQQRVFLARALLAQPDLLVLDEPTSGVDMRTAESVLHLLADLNRQGLTILMTTHDLNAAAAHVPWVICLNRRVIGAGAPEEVFTEEILSATYQGEMLVVRHNGVILVQQKPHHHTRQEILPDPVPGHAADLGDAGNGAAGHTPKEGQAYVLAV
jgi:zinc/manganese transport system ATP-binding protein/zinc transport system ATP-binding protein